MHCAAADRGCHSPSSCSPSVRLSLNQTFVKKGQASDRSLGSVNQVYRQGHSRLKLPRSITLCQVLLRLCQHQHTFSGSTTSSFLFFSLITLQCVLVFERSSWPGLVLLQWYSMHISESKPSWLETTHQSRGFLCVGVPPQVRTSTVPAEIAVELCSKGAVIAKA